MGELAPAAARIQHARLEDLYEILRLLDEANKYAEQKSGVPAWTKIGNAYKDVEARVANNEFFVIRNQQGEITSSIAVSDTHEEWGESGKDGKALYFTKYMKFPDKAEDCEGSLLMQFAAQEAARRGKSLLRCDAVGDQKKMVDHYIQLGFQKKASFPYESSGRECVLLEAPINAILDNHGT